MDITPMLPPSSLAITPEILSLIAEIDEFKDGWKAYRNLAPKRLNALRHVATIESVAPSTRIEGTKLSDREVEDLLQNLEQKQFSTRDEQEVAGYADGNELGVIFETSPPFDTPQHMEQLVSWGAKHYRINSYMH